MHTDICMYVYIRYSVRPEAVNCIRCDPTQSDIIKTLL